MPEPWLDRLLQLVAKKPLVILRFAREEWESLEGSRHGLRSFSIARPHGVLQGIQAPTACLLLNAGSGGSPISFGILASRTGVSTLESRIKVSKSVQLSTDMDADLLRLVDSPRHRGNLEERLRGSHFAVPLSPKLSVSLVTGLASVAANRAAMRIVGESLSAPTHFKGAAAQQEDAVHSALTAFGIPLGEEAVSLELISGKETALARIPIIEDSVVEHDARTVPGYELVGSDLTGRAIFERANQRLEVFTANRRDLEHCFGVDLIYLNASRQNLVMVQYKMLEPNRRRGADVDWIYRPDEQLDDEIARMRRFSAGRAPGRFEYRLNPSIFYLKFVKRDGALANGGFLLPLEHFEMLCANPDCKGPNGGLRVSYNTLNGTYLRQGTFLDLVGDGYVGAYAQTTADLRVLVEGILAGNRALVAAIQGPQGR